MKKGSNILPAAQYHRQTNLILYNCCGRILVIVLLICFSITTTGQSTNKGDTKPETINPGAEENLAHDIFTAFQKRSDSLWVLLFPTNAEYRELTRLMTEAKIIKLPQSTINEMLARHDKEAIAAYKTEFHDFLKQADSLGIQWNDAAYQKFEFNTLYPEDFIRKYMNGNIWFSCKNTHFIIEGIEAVEVSHGFKLQSIKSIRRADDGE